MSDLRAINGALEENTRRLRQNTAAIERNNRRRNELATRNDAEPREIASVNEEQARLLEESAALQEESDRLQRASARLSSTGVPTPPPPQGYVAPQGILGRRPKPLSIGSVFTPSGSSFGTCVVLANKWTALTSDGSRIGDLVADDTGMAVMYIVSARPIDRKTFSILRHRVYLARWGSCHHYELTGSEPDNRVFYATSRRGSAIGMSAGGGTSVLVLHIPGDQKVFALNMPPSVVRTLLSRYLARIDERRR